MRDFVRSSSGVVNIITRLAGYPGIVSASDLNRLDEYIARLDEQGLSLMVCEEGTMIFKSKSKGVRPYLEAIDSLGARLRGTVIIDKIVGRAAALLVIYSGAAEVHAGVINPGGRTLLDTAGVRLFFGKEIEHIKTVDGRIYCPFEAMVQGIDDPSVAYYAIVDKMNSFKKAKC